MLLLLIILKLRVRSWGKCMQMFKCILAIFIFVCIYRIYWSFQVEYPRLAYLFIHCDTVIPSDNLFVCLFVLSLIYLLVYLKTDFMVSAYCERKRRSHYSPEALKSFHVFRLGSMEPSDPNTCSGLICRSCKKVKSSAPITMSGPFHCSPATIRNVSIQEESSGFCLREPQYFHDLCWVSWCACCLLKANINCTEISISWQLWD